MSVRVTLEKVTAVLGGNAVLHDVDLDVAPGELVTLLGPSGSGKTTTLNVIAGFVPQSAGHVRFDGDVADALAPERREIGFVFQSYALFPHMTVGDNVAFPLRARRMPRAARQQRVDECLELVQLGGLAGRPVRDLSGGQQQRVALARALAFRPRVLLLDEPLAALDQRLRQAMQLEIKRIHAEVGVTTVAVTHDQTEALTMSDRVAVVRDGRLEQLGTPEDLYRRPRTSFVARFLGEANLVPVPSGVATDLGLRLRADAGGLAVLRPEDLALGSGPGAGGGCRARVLALDFQGARWRVAASCLDADQELVVSVPPGVERSRVAPGAEVLLTCPAGAVHVIEGGAGPAGPAGPAPVPVAEGVG